MRQQSNPAFAASLALTIIVAGAAPAIAAPEAPGACPHVEPLAGEPTNPEEWRARIENARKRNEAFACQARLDLVRRVAERARSRGGSGKLEDFVGDDTLQRGDVVVTDKGFRVFRGSADAPNLRDFAPLEAGGGKPGLRRTLNDLEKASGLRRGATSAR